MSFHFLILNLQDLLMCLFSFKIKTRFFTLLAIVFKKFEKLNQVIIDCVSL